MRALTAILILCCAVLLAQEAPKPDSSFQTLMNDFALLQENHSNNQVLLHDLGKDLQELPKAPTPEAALLSSMRLNKRVTEAIKSLQREQDSQVQFSNSISQYSGTRQLLRQEQSYLSHYLDELQKYGLEEENALFFLKNTAQQLQYRITNTLPPTEFTCALGIEFKLVMTNKESFYISRSPLTADQFEKLHNLTSSDITEEELTQHVIRFRSQGITHDEARWVADTIGHLCGFPCRLPTAKQLAVLKEYGAALKQALWLDGELPADFKFKSREAQQRFGMEMSPIWDPAGMLRTGQDAQALSEELSWASYPELGCAVVTDIQAGRNALLEQMEKLLEIEKDTQSEEALPEETPETSQEERKDE